MKTATPNDLRTVKALTVSQVMEALTVDRGTIYRWMRQRNDPLPALKLGRLVRVPLIPFERWLERRGGGGE